jgi:molecular chaperone GrpE
MERPGRITRAQERAAAIDVSPARLAAEVEKLTRERDKARREVDALQKRLEGLVPDDGGDDLETLRREREEYLNALQRERAEFQNFRRRTAEEREAMLGLAGEDLIRKVLAVADDFDRAIDHRPGAIAEDPWVEGITAIDRKLRQLLDSEGVTPIEAAPGTRFDPRSHEAVANVPGTGRAGGEIVEELRRGYRLRDRVIRPALVAVAADGGDETNIAATETEPPIH